MNQSKEIHTLIPDILSLYDQNIDHVPSEENLTWLAENLKEVFRTRFLKRVEPESPLRFSALGKKDRQIWYASRADVKPEEMRPETLLKFQFGDMYELLLLFLAKEAGHDVQMEQREVEASGVKGHIDCVIDGKVVDVKSASPFGFKKFEDSTIFDDDPFGYIPQLSGYANVLQKEGTIDKGSAYFLAVEKVMGKLALTEVPQFIIEDNEPEPRIEHLKKVIANDEPPPRCYEDVPDGKSGNRKLSSACSYCSFKHECWPDVRVFAYSTGPRFLTVVAETPRVPEITSGGI